ncbi:universal stress protein [Hydrogenophaga sp.]|uniref:universal stress protein n=1 Tax=Hydrogenophaga sp. TaxID=1904254 RepID=UPI003F70B00D
MVATVMALGRTRSTAPSRIASSSEGSEITLRSLERYLKVNGVTVATHSGGPGDNDVGNSLLSMAADMSAELLVMGCYGHSRAREWVLGGATRTILQTMTLPVLMSH